MMTLLEDVRSPWGNHVKQGTVGAKAYLIPAHTP